MSVPGMVFADNATNEQAADDAVNFVDERYEVVALIFRLAKHEHFTENTTPYQRSITSTFRRQNRHPAVRFITGSKEEYDRFDAVQLAIHLEKTDNGFVLVDDLTAIVDDEWITWTSANLERFVKLLNDFYTDSKFAEFFQQHQDYYREISTEFDNEFYSKINFDWFEELGANPDNFRAILSPVGSMATRNATGIRHTDNPDESIYYITRHMGEPDGNRFFFVVGAAFSRDITDAVAREWFKDNEQFRKLTYNNVGTAFGDMSSALGIIYGIENEQVTLDEGIAFAKSAPNWRYNIAHIYNMVREHFEFDTPEAEITYLINPDANLLRQIRNIIDVDFELYLGEISYIVDERWENAGQQVAYRFLNLKGNRIRTSSFTQTNWDSNWLGTQTGDVLILTRDGKPSLYIDLGAQPNATWQGVKYPDARKYHIIELD
jgi:hypothetical protein